MTRIILVLLTIGFFAATARADELDEPPAMHVDTKCLERRAELEAHLRSIADVPVNHGKPCPQKSNPEDVRRRQSLCLTDSHKARVEQFIYDGLEADSSMLSTGVPRVVALLGEPAREDVEDGFWDIDIYEIPRTLYFTGVTVKTRDWVDDADNFDLGTGTVKPTDRIYEMLVESGDFQFAHGLSLDSSRDDVEAALGLPCMEVAYFGRTVVRKKTSYTYGWSRHSVTFKFFGAGRVESVHWYYDSVWH